MGRIAVLAHYPSVLNPTTKPGAFGNQLHLYSRIKEGVVDILKGARFLQADGHDEQVCMLPHIVCMLISFF